MGEFRQERRRTAAAHPCGHPRRRGPGQGGRRLPSDDGSGAVRLRPPRGRIRAVD